MDNSLGLTPQRRDYFMVPVDLIDIDWASNYTEATRGDIQGLTRSICKEGVRDPVKCSRNGDRFTLREGFRRMHCVLAINKEAKSDDEKILRVPVLLADRHANDADYAISQLLENAHREDATPIEKATAYHTLLNVHGLELEEIAARLGEDSKTIERYLLLLEGTQPLRKAIESGKIGVTAASTIIKGHRGDEKAQKEALDTALAATSGKRATSRQVQKEAPRKKAAYRTTRGIKDVEVALKDVTGTITSKTYATDDEAEEFLYQGYQKALEWMLGKDAPWESPGKKKK